MPADYWRSPEGEKEYEKIGRGYETTLADEYHANFLAMTKDSTHSNKNRIEILNIVRLLANDGKEYLLYNETMRSYDNLGNERHSNRDNLGKYAIPIPRYEMRVGPNMAQETVIVDIIRVDTGYSIPFSAAEAEEIHKRGANDEKQQAPTQYYIKKEGGSPMKVKNFEAFKTGEFWELEKFGMTSQQFMEDQKAIQAAKAVADQATSPKEREEAAKTLIEAGEATPGAVEGEIGPGEAKRRQRR